MFRNADANTIILVFNLNFVWKKFFKYILQNDKFTVFTIIFRVKLFIHIYWIHKQNVRYIIL